LLAEVARGGMGIVYQARHAARGQVVALKMMQGSAADPQHVERFDREVRVATWLKHPNIVPVYDVSRHQGEPYYTMEFEPGGSLAQQRERLLADPSAVLTLMAKVAEAIQHAHGQGVVHRDLKLSNVLLAADGTPKVTDFGLAKLSAGDLNLTQTGAAVGTVPYMAPEQAAGRTKQIGPATDIWALGVMLYELLTGRRPFGGEDSDAVKRQIRKGKPPRPRTLRPELSEAVETVLLRCLEKEPRRRYQTAGELADHLGRCARGEPILTRPERLRRGLRWPLLLGATVIPCLAVVIAGATAFLHRPKDSEAQPLQAEQYPDAPITLIGPGAGPQDFRWVVGQKQAAIEPQKPGDPLVISTTAWVSLLELRARPPWKSYRLEAKLRQPGTLHEEAGIYVGRHRYSIYDSVCAMRLEERRGGGNVYFDILPVPNSDPSGVSRAVGIGRHRFALPSPDKSDGWREIAIDVLPEEVRFHWAGSCVHRVPREEIDRLAAGSLLELAGVANWQLDTQGGLGLYLAKAPASFESVILRPLSE
jgi:serine/threonine-protein kinase